MFKYSLAAVGLIYILNWVDLLTLSKPDFDGTGKVAFNRKEGGTYFNLELNNSHAYQPEQHMRLYVGYWF